MQPLQRRDVGWIIGMFTLILLLVGLPGVGMMTGRGMMGPGMMGGYAGWSPWWGLAMMAVWALPIGGVALLVIWLVRRAGGIAGSVADRDCALDILRERYARGEITREEYEAMRRDLHG
jgi:putative membrane protein